MPDFRPGSCFYAHTEIYLDYIFKDIKGLKDASFVNALKRMVLSFIQFI